MEISFSLQQLLAEQEQSQIPVIDVLRLVIISSVISDL